MRCLAKVSDENITSGKMFYIPISQLGIALYFIYCYQFQVYTKDLIFTHRNLNPTTSHLSLLS